LAIAHTAKKKYQAFLKQKYKQTFLINSLLNLIKIQKKKT